jgi:hypothetical protein
MYASTSIPTLSSLSAINGTVIWIVTGVVILYVLLYSAVFFYHWYTYAIQRQFAKITVLVYTAGALALISSMVTAAFFVQ